MSAACERSRTYISLELDGELSSLESRFLEAHFGRCADCRAFASDVRAITGHVREAPLEAPAHGVRVTRLRAPLASRVQLGAAAALAVAVIGTVSLVSGRVDDERPTRIDQELRPSPREIRVISTAQLGGRAPTSGGTVVRQVDLLL